MTPQIFVNDRHLTMTQFEEQWKQEKDLARDISYKTKFNFEVHALPDPTDPRLAKPTRQAAAMKATMARESTFVLIRLPDFSQWSAAYLTRQLLHVTKHPYIRKCNIDNGMDKSGAKAFTMVACFQGRDVLTVWKNLFGTSSDDQTVKFFLALEQYGIVHHVTGTGVEASYWTLHPYYRSHINKYVVLNDLIDVKQQQPIPEGAQQLVLSLWRQMDELWNNVPLENIREHKLFQNFEEDICRLQGVSLATDGILNDYNKCIAFGLNLFHVMLRHALLLHGSNAGRKGGESSFQELPVQPPTDFHFELPYFLQSIRYRVGMDTISLLGLSNWLLYRNYRALAGPRTLARSHWLRWLLDRPQHLAGVKTDVRIVLALSWETISSPTIIPFHPEALNDEINWSARNFCGRFVKLDEERNNVLLPQHFDWYRLDFSGAIHGGTSALMEHVIQYLNTAQVQTLERMHRANKNKKYILFAHQLGVVFVGHNWKLRPTPDALKSTHETTQHSVSSSSDESPDLISALPDEDQSRADFTYVSALTQSTWGRKPNKWRGATPDYDDYSLPSGFDFGDDGTVLHTSKRSLHSEKSEFQEILHSGGKQLLGEGDDLTLETWDVRSNHVDGYGYSLRSGFDAAGGDGTMIGGSNRSVFSEESEFQQVLQVGGRQLLGEGDAWLDSTQFRRRGSQSSHSSS